MDYFQLDNGLNVYVLSDKTVSIVALNIIYDVGSRDEDPEKTGFAHLFEHLMFGGSVNIPSYDEPLQKVGGENNAFTTPDYTNYYLTVPANNIETGFWLESDRMLGLSFNPEVLEVQRKVVIEEFRQRYLNRPYGDMYHHLRSLLYQKHPYRWPTIGKDISHIENATMEDVKDFFGKHYVPNRAKLVIGGNIEVNEARRLTEKWFGPIPRGPEYNRNLPRESEQTSVRRKTVSGNVPSSALTMAWGMGGRLSENYYAVDLLSDVLGRGKSSRLYHDLVNKKRLFTSINCSIAGSIDPGYIQVQGFLNEGVSFEEAEEGIQSVIDELLSGGINDAEYEKVINQALATLSFGRVELLEKCMNLAFFALLNKIEMYHKESHLISGVTREDILNAAQEVLKKEKTSILFYEPS